MATLAPLGAVLLTVVATMTPHCGAPRTVTGDYGWTSYSFADASHGFAAGARCDDTDCEGGLLRTADGGRTWTPASYPPGRYDDDPLPRVVAVTPSVAYLVDDGLRVTRDAGATWRRVSVPAPLRLLAIDVAGDSLWALGSRCSADGGRDCVRLLTGTVGGDALTVAPGPPPRTSDVRLARRDARRAWLLDGSWTTGDVRLLATEDGGRSWQRRDVPCRPFVSPGLTREGWAGGVAVAFDGSLWLLCDDGEPANTTQRALYVSADGGRTWAGGHRSDGKLWSYLPLSAAELVVGDGNRGLLRSGDRGRTWRVPVAADGNGGYALDFADAAHGWAQDFTSNVLYVTADGGRTWRSLGPIG